jgi:hypothetical protein
MREAKKDQKVIVLGDTTVRELGERAIEWSWR